MIKTQIQIPDEVYHRAKALFCRFQKGVHPHLCWIYYQTH
jgi:hypothetical protein